MTLRVLILGGYGNFGGYVARALAGDARITLIVAGRNAGKASAFAAALGAANRAEGAALDIATLSADDLATLRPDLVIHTVGPVYGGRPEDARLLASAYRSSLSLAMSRALRTVAFPAISCGIFGYPLDEAAPLAVGVAREAEWDLDCIRFVLFDAAAHAVFERAIGG